MFCSNCGNEIQSGVRFCSKCGASVSGGQQEVLQPGAVKPKEKKVQKKSMIVSIIIIVVAVILVGGVLGYFISGHLKAKEGGGGNNHVEMRDSVREDFIDEIKEVEKEGYLLFGRDGQYSSAVILDIDINGAPVVVCEYSSYDRGTVLGFLFRTPSGFFGEDTHKRVFVDSNNAEMYFDIEKERIVIREEQEGRTYIRVYALDASLEFDEFVLVVADGYKYESDNGVSIITMYDEDGYVQDILSFDTDKEFEDYVEKEFLGKNAISYTELMSGDNVLTTTAELLDAWEDY